MKKWLQRKGILSSAILVVTPLLFFIVAFTWESTGDSLLNPLIPHQQSWGGKSNVSNTSVPSVLCDLAVGGTDIHLVWKENSGLNANIHFKNKAKEDAGWSSALDLTATTAGQCLNPAIAVVENGTSDRIHVVWDDKSQGNRDILYRKSLDGGSTWDNPLGSGPDSITNDTYDATHPDIAIAGTIPHVVWHGVPPGYTENQVFYSQDPAGTGVSWTAPSTLSTTPANVNEFPAIAVDGSNRIHVTWHQGATPNEVIKYRRFTGTWSSVQSLSGSGSTHSDIAAKGNDVYVVWNTKLSDTQYRVWYRRSSDGGGTWQPAALIATVATTLISGFPSPRVSIDAADNVHVVWHAVVGLDKPEIWYSQSTDWSSVVNISQTSDESQVASIGTDSGGDVHVAWQEQVGGRWDIFYIRTVPTGGIYLPIITKNR